DNCDAGWLADQSVRYPITLSRPGCYGDRNSLPGVRSYGQREPQEEYDVYCYARELRGTVFYATVPGRFTWQGARRHCRSRGASLATTGQLYLAWREGLDQCDPGWLADGSVRYPIRLPRRKCGGEASGVRTLYQFPNPLSSDNVLVEHSEDLGTSGDTRDTPRDLHNLLAQPGLGEDEQLRAESDNPRAQRGDLPRAALSPSPAAPGLGMSDGTPLVPTTASSLAWPHEEEVLNVVDQVLQSSQWVPSSTSTALQEDSGEPPATLLPRSQNPAQHGTGASLAPPGLGMVPSTAAETTPVSSHTPKKSYAGLNGRYFQLQQQSQDPTVAPGDPTVVGDTVVVPGDPTWPMVSQAPILALELKGDAANALETWSIPHASTESLGQEGPYASSNAVEEKISRDGNQPHIPSARGDSPRPPLDATEDFSGDTLSQEDGGSVPAWPPLPPAPLVAEGPEPAPEPRGDSGDSSETLGDVSLERQRKAVTFLPEPSQEQLDESRDAGNGSAEPSSAASMSTVVWHIPSPSPLPVGTEVTPWASTEQPVEAAVLESVAEEGSTAVPSEEDAPTSPSEEDVPTSPSEEDAPTSPNEEDVPASPQHPPARRIPSEEDVPTSPNEEDVPTSPSEEDAPASPSEEDVPSSPNEEDAPTSPNEEDAPTSPSEEDAPTSPSEEDAPTSPNEKDIPTSPSEEDIPTSPSEEDAPTSPSKEDAPTTPREEDASGEVKREEPSVSPSSATHSPWPSPTAPHPWVLETSESLGLLFEPSVAAEPGGTGVSPLLDADSGSGEEPGLEERELLVWESTSNTSQH
ncbi:PREDICTED: LOW QUALITY PROTEIN: aggrecan core protein-like, partial [Acanthisitta chloris]|uniref:LOW QUALITY PROTEIN: aggrecan core protein-like n=1 Tax=Acanthisitta chloris TaxID=57068 RepID=UPI0004F0CFCF